MTMQYSKMNECALNTTPTVAFVPNKYLTEES